MAVDLAKLVAPAHTAVVTSEIQQGVIGESAVLPHLANAVRESGAIARIADVVRAGRAAGARVVHGTAHFRNDRQGSNTNARLFAVSKRSGVSMHEGSSASEVVPEVGVEPSDIVMPRMQGLNPMAGTELDAVLRNLGVS